ncbi:MAG: DNA-directed RNA polymerase subunit K [Candidatus Diapherotrites archaeon]|nr:DNA-directed RNA polymerase subunit K [Candidatus Diapherotrites archaeon]
MDSLTRFELTRIVSARALQLSYGAPALVKATKDKSNFDIAKKEIEDQVIPFVVLRKLPNGETIRVSL